MNDLARTHVTIYQDGSIQFGSHPKSMTLETVVLDYMLWEADRLPEGRKTLTSFFQNMSPAETLF